MIAVFSTSSPLAGIALVTPGGEVVFRAVEQRSTNASGFLLENLGNGLALIGETKVTGYVADIGPGSFIGARVGVVLAKMLGYLNGVPCAGVTAFDLISPSQWVAIPNRKADFLLRRPGHSPQLITEVPLEAVGYRLGRNDQFPDPVLGPEVINHLEWFAAADFLPHYEVEPSISTPKQSFGAWRPQ